jgi:hypothetical protein
MTTDGLSLSPSPSLPITAGLDQGLQIAVARSQEGVSAEGLGQGTIGRFLFHVQGSEGVTDTIRYRMSRVISRDSHLYSLFTS